MVLAAGIPPICASSAAISATAADVGRFAIVQNQVTTLKPGATAPVPAAAGAAIVLEEQETTGPASGAKMTFGEGGVVSLGQSTTFKVSRQSVDEATGASTSTMDLVLGKARVFVSRFWSGRPEVRVNTPTAVVGVRGSEVGVEVFEDGTTVVTLFSGSAWVEAKASRGERRDLAAGERARIDASGAFAGPPAQAGLDEIATLRARTEPDPMVPRQPLSKGPQLEAPKETAGRPSGGTRAGEGKSATAAQTASPSSSGDLWGNPAVSIPVPPLTRPQKPGTTPG